MIFQQNFWTAMHISLHVVKSAAWSIKKRVLVRECLR